MKRLVHETSASFIGRDADPTLKPALLEKVLAYLLEHGLHDLSLRPLAKAAGTTARMLIYHFGSKEQLLVGALELAQREQLRVLSDFPAPQAKAEELKRLWEWFTSDELEPFVRLVIMAEIQGLNGRTVYTSFAEQTLDQWTSFMQGRLACASPTARLVMTTFTGLLLDKVIIGDVPRVEEGFQIFLDSLSKGDYL